MNGLVAFLRARLDEEAAEAEKLTEVDDYSLDPWVIQREETGEWNSYAYLRIAKARALANVQSGRQAIEHYERVAARRDQHPEYELAAGAVEVQLKIRALSHVAHPDYREEWKP